MAGRNSSSLYYSKLFLNDGQGNFSESSIPNMEGMDEGTIVFGDIDGDNDPDLLITGELNFTGFILQLYINKGSSFPTSTIETPSIPMLTVVPNPFHQSTTFEIESIPGDQGILRIFNSNGMLQFQKEVVSETNFTFNHKHLPSGIYFYEVVSKTGLRIYGGKVVKY